MNGYRLIVNPARKTLDLVKSDEVVKKLDQILLREGRKSVREAAQAALDRIRPSKK